MHVLAEQLIYCITGSKQGGRYGFAYPAFRVAPWCSINSSLNLGSKMLSSQGTPFSNSVARVGFSPIVPPLNSRTPSTALPSSLAGPPINPMSPTCAYDSGACSWAIRSEAEHTTQTDFSHVQACCCHTQTACLFASCLTAT